MLKISRLRADQNLEKNKKEKKPLFLVNMIRGEPICPASEDTPYMYTPEASKRRLRYASLMQRPHPEGQLSG